jgi:RNA polymerase sigma-70 factor (ECF subfamily)
MQQQLDSARRARSNSEDICLIAKFLDGSESAFEELFGKYQRRLFSLCRHFLGNDTDAEDAVQDAFLSIYHGLARFRGDSGFYTWAYGITVRSCISLRRKHRRKTESLDEMPEPVDQGGADIDAIVVRQAVSKLPDQHRVVLILKYYEQLSMEEIAQVLGCSADRIKMRLHRARNTLRGELDLEMGGDR